MKRKVFLLFFISYFSCNSSIRHTNIDNCITKIKLEKRSEYAPTPDYLNIEIDVNNSLYENLKKHKYIDWWFSSEVFSSRKNGTISCKELYFNDTTKSISLGSTISYYVMYSQKEVDSVCELMYHSIEVVIKDHWNKEWMIRPCTKLKKKTT